MVIAVLKSLCDRYDVFLVEICLISLLFYKSFLCSLQQAEEIEYSCEKCNGKSAVVTHKFNRLPR